MTTTLIEARALTKHFSLGRGQTVHAVDEVSLAIAEREVVGLVGESGSGKSTFGKTLVGLHSKTAGLQPIEGAPPDLFAPPIGCAYFARCPHAMRVCERHHPPNFTVAPGHAALCWLHDRAAPRVPEVQGGGRT